MCRSPYRYFDIANRVMRLNRVIPLYEPDRAAVDGRIPFVDVVHFLEREAVTLIPEQFLNALSVSVVPFGVHLRRYSRRRQVA